MSDKVYLQDKIQFTSAQYQAAGGDSSSQYYITFDENGDLIPTLEIASIKPQIKITSANANTISLKDSNSNNIPLFNKIIGDTNTQWVYQVKDEIDTYIVYVNTTAQTPTIEVTELKQYLWS